LTQTGHRATSSTIIADQLIGLAVIAIDDVQWTIARTLRRGLNLCDAGPISLPPADEVV
jgi:hypothetical protein